MRRRKYLTYARAKQTISKFQFKTLLEYREFVIENNVNTLPIDPSAIYAKDGYKTHDFLGLSKETYDKNLSAYRREHMAYMRSLITAESHIKRANTHIALNKLKPKVVSSPKPKTSPVEKINVQPVVNTIIGLDPDKVIAFLISEDVEPATIVKLVAEMDIKSSTLMNDLCKYMQERSQRQAQLWRPTAYQTAEAEFTKVG